MIKEPEWYRQHPIFDTDFNKPPSELIEEIRSKLAHLRGQLRDIGFGYPGFKQELDDVEGLLTCGLVCLYETSSKMKKISL